MLQQATYVGDPMLALQVARSVFIKQSVEWAEIITGYETPNRYNVFFKNPGDNRYTMLFNCKEMSECCERTFCAGDSRPFKMHLKHLSNQNIDNDYNKDVYAILDKPYKCTCYCCYRPEMTGTIQGRAFGKVTQPYTYCDPVFHIIDAHGIVRYSITTDCCKCGFCCRGGCGMFEAISFLIFPGENCDSSNENGSVGKIIKHTMGIQTLYSDADNYEVFFPSDATPEDKLNLISAALMIDYMFFEENPNSR